MPRAGPLTQILRSLTVAELRSVRRGFCPRVSEYDGDKDAFVGRLHRSLSRSFDEGEYSYADLFEHVRDEIETQGPQRVTTRIRHAIEDLEVSSNAGSKDTTAVRESWISSELFQALRHRFSDQPYDIEQEVRYGRNAVDLQVSHRREDRHYVVEVKLAGSYSSRERLLSQLRRYRKKVPHLRRTYVAMVAERERDLPGNKESVAHVVAEAEREPDTEVIVVGPSSLRY